jgi:uncharacterized protein
MSFDLKPIFRDEEKEIPVNLKLIPKDYESFGEEFSDDITLEGNFSKLDGIVTLTANIFFEISAPCDRCATDVKRKYKIKIKEKIADHLENEEENDDYIIAPNMKLDITDTIITAVILSVPAKFLCKEDCKGVCPKCGKNLNEGPCDCKEEVKDSRWAALAQLLD